MGAAEGARRLASAQRVRAFSFVVLAAASWGIGTVLSKRAVGELPPLTLLAAQLLVSVAILSIAVWWTGHSLRGTDRRLALLGALNPGLAYALSLAGLTLISASASVLIWAMEPILILLLAAIVLGERPGTAIGALSLLAFAGLVVALGIQADGAAIVGVALSLAGVLCCVVYSVATRRWIAASPSTLGVVASQQAVALVVVLVALVVAGVGGWSIAPTLVTVPGLASVVASGLLYYAAAYLLYLNALRVLPVSIAAISFYLVPVFGVAAAIAAGESLSASQWLGALLTIAAVLAVGVVDLRRLPAPQVARTPR
ncbi:MAG TPA: DMT family transporter [Candidatus Limnocylindrales bacterium]